MKQIAYRHPLTGELFLDDDPRLVGMGTPPHAPGPVGHGQIALIPEVVEDAEIKAAKERLAAHKIKTRGGHPVFGQFVHPNSEEAA